MSDIKQFGYSSATTQTSGTNIGMIRSPSFNTPLRHGAIRLASENLGHDPVGQSLGSRLLFGTIMVVQSFEEV
jgi:hypothetical protein